MSVAVGLLDFYILEASEYVDQLDALVGAAVQTPPESTPFITAARALRGSSTMAKLLRMAELAGSVERVGRGLRDGSVAMERRAAIGCRRGDRRHPDPASHRQNLGRRRGTARRGANRGVAAVRAGRRGSGRTRRSAAR